MRVARNEGGSLFYCHVISREDRAFTSVYD